VLPSETTPTVIHISIYNNMQTLSPTGRRPGTGSHPLADHEEPNASDDSADQGHRERSEKRTEVRSLHKRTSFHRNIYNKTICPCINMTTLSPAGRRPGTLVRRSPCACRSRCRCRSRRQTASSSSRTREAHRSTMSSQADLLSQKDL